MNYRRIVIVSSVKIIFKLLDLFDLISFVYVGTFLVLWIWDKSREWILPNWCNTNNASIKDFCSIEKHKRTKNWHQLYMIQQCTIIVPSWLKTQIWVKWISQFYRNIGPQTALAYPNTKHDFISSILRSVRNKTGNTVHTSLNSYYKWSIKSQLLKIPFLA
jgi:hypothetical protein